MKKALFIDSNSFVHRSFHAIPPLTSPSGKPVGALYGLINTMLKILNEESPRYVAAAIDTPEQTFREKMFEEYKAHRPKTPDDLRAQLGKVEDVFESLNITTIKKPGFEADDIIATLVKKTPTDRDVQAVVFSGDLDSLQVVDKDRVIALIPKRGISKMVRYNEYEVEKKYGIPPKKLAEYKGLVGDSSDNIPGVPGIGPKTAVEIINKFGSIERACVELEKKTNPSKTELALIKNKQQAVLSKDLATVKTDVPINVSFDQILWSGINEKKLKQALEEFGFKTILKRVGAYNKNVFPASKTKAQKGLF